MQDIIGKDGKPVTEEKEITIPAFKLLGMLDRPEPAAARELIPLFTKAKLSRPAIAVPDDFAL